MPEDMGALRDEGRALAIEVLSDSAMANADWQARGRPALYAPPDTPERREEIHRLIDDIILDSGRRRVAALEAAGLALVPADAALLAPHPTPELTPEQRAVVEEWRSAWPVLAADILAVIDDHFPPVAVDREARIRERPSGLEPGVTWYPVEDTR